MTSEVKVFKERIIRADSTKCTGCYLCQLYCSYKVTKAFNPSRAYIEILRQVNQPTEYTISFKDECNACGLCAKYCLYGALIHQKPT